jgi:hypothetical protein
MPKKDTQDLETFYFPEHNKTVQAVDRQAADKQLKDLLAEEKKGDEASE